MRWGTATQCYEHVKITSDEQTQHTQHAREACRSVLGELHERLVTPPNQTLQNDVLRAGPTIQAVNTELARPGFHQQQESRNFVTCDASGQGRAEHKHCTCGLVQSFILSPAHGQPEFCDAKVCRRMLPESSSSQWNLFNHDKLVDCIPSWAAMNSQ